MLRLILKQTNWSVLGAVFGFAVGFFIKIYLVNKVGLLSYGSYVIGQTMASTFDTFLAIGIPYVIIRYIPSFLEKDKGKAMSLAAFSLKYSLIIGSLFAILIFCLSDEIATVVYRKEGISFILSLMALYIPLSLYMGMITALYRAVLKVKEIIIYGTILSVSVRAILTFVIFQFTTDISYFIFIELFTQILTLSILTLNFHRNEFALNYPVNLKLCEESSLLDYGKQMFLNSVVMFLGGQSLAFLIGIYLPSDQVGAYGILITFANLTVFLLINLNRIFAPAISKLYDDNKIEELNELYKKTTFIINVITVPFAVLLMLFSSEVLSLYGEEMKNYNFYLIILMLGSIISLSAGSSGTIMVMAGLERKNLKIQFIKALLTIGLAIILIPIYSFNAVVFLYVGCMIFLNVFQLIYIYINIRISPFSTDLLYVYLIASPVIVYSLLNTEQFQLLDFFIIPIGFMTLYLILLKKPILEIVKLMR